MAFSAKFTVTEKSQADLKTLEQARAAFEVAHLSKKWIQKMQSRAFICEAHYTNFLEGARLSLIQSERLLKGEELVKVDPDEVRAIFNWRKAYDLAANVVCAGVPISEDLVGEMHQLFVTGILNPPDAGRYRKSQNYIINIRKREVVHTPPVSSKVPRQMREFIQWISGVKRPPVHPILIAGIIHFQIIYIHPFLDGNGHVARMLSALQLSQQGYDFHNIMSLSEEFAKDSVNYHRILQTVRDNEMDLTIWLEYFVNAIIAQFHQIQERCHRVLKLVALEQDHVLSVRKKGALELACLHGEFTFADFHLKYPDERRKLLQRDLKQLIDVGLLKAEGVIYYPSVPQPKEVVAETAQTVDVEKAVN